MRMHVKFVLLMSALATEAVLDIYFTRLNCANLSPQLVAHVSCKLLPTETGRPDLYVDFEFSQDVNKMHLSAELLLTFNKKTIKYDSSELDCCKALMEYQSDFFSKMLIKEIRRTSNAPPQCPFKKNVRYVINGYRLYAAEIPNYAPDLKFNANFLLTINNTKIISFSSNGKVEKKNRKVKPKTLTI